MPHRVLLHLGGIYAELHEQQFGARQPVRTVQVGGLTPALVDEARRAWQDRLQRTYRALQVRIRFMSEVVGAGDPLEIYGAAVEGVQHKVRQLGLCMVACESFGAAPKLPDLSVGDEPWPAADAPMLERAVATAIAHLAIEETLRLGSLRDLAGRCATSPLCDGINEVLEGSERRQRFAWTYVKDGIRRLAPTFLPQWRHLVEVTLAPHQRWAAGVRSTIPEDMRSLDAFPEPDRANVGIHSSERQALLFEKIVREELAPRLREAELT